MNNEQAEIFKEAYLQLAVAVDMNETGLVLSEQRLIKIKKLIQEMFDVLLTHNVRNTNEPEDQSK